MGGKSTALWLKQRMQKGERKRFDNLAIFAVVNRFLWWYSRWTVLHFMKRETQKLEHNSSCEVRQILYWKWNWKSVIQRNGRICHTGLLTCWLIKALYRHYIMTLIFLKIVTTEFSLKKLFKRQVQNGVFQETESFALIVSAAVLRLKKSCKLVKEGKALLI